MADVADETQWQCDCGMWIPTAYYRHTHHAVKPASLAEMRASRAYAEAGLIPTADLDSVTMTHVLRDPRHQTRVKPL